MSIRIGSEWKIPPPLYLSKQVRTHFLKRVFSVSGVYVNKEKSIKKELKRGIII